MSGLLGWSGYLAIGLAVSILVVAGGMWLRARLAARAAAGENEIEPWWDENVLSQDIAHVKYEDVAEEPLPLAPILTFVGCVVLAAIAIFLQSRLWANQADLRPLWWLLVVGAAFGVVGRISLRGSTVTADPPPAKSPDEAGFALSLRAFGDRKLAIFLAASFVFEVISLGLFWSGSHFTPAWAAHAMACILFVVGAWVGTGTRLREIAPGWTRLDTIALATVMLLAFVARFWRDGSIPDGLWFDEADRGLDAIRILTERYLPPVYAPTFIQEPVGMRYLITPLVWLLGRDPLALRLPAIVFGTLGVGAIYLLARLLYGWRTGIVAGALAIGFVWHLNFSRVAFPAIPSLTCDTVAVVLLVLGLRRGNRFVLAAAGVAAAAGQYFYFSSELMLVVLAFVGLHQLIAGRASFLRLNFAGLALYIAGFLITVGPVLQVAVSNPDQFNSRAQTVSIFNEVNQAGNWSPLINNIETHLLMFNVRGDPNGRHNWSGRPMLDLVTGGLAVAGVALALTHFWRLENALPLFWLPIAMLGGTLSLSFEAPQSHRSIDAIVPAVLFAALPLGLLWRQLDRVLGPLLSADGAPPGGVLGRYQTTIASCALIGVTLLATNAMNLNRYFTQQQPDSRTWQEMSTPQTEAGRQIVPLPSTLKVYLEPSWIGSPSLRFVAADPHPYAPFDPAVDLPITDPAAAIFLGDQKSVADRIAALYPMAQRLFTKLPDGVAIGGYGFVMPEEVLQASRGVTAHFESGGKVADRREASLDLDWRTPPPVPAPFSATLTAMLTVPTYGEYQLALDGPPTVALTLDGNEILKGGAAGTLRLARGNHALIVKGTDLGKEPVRLRWGFQAEPPHPIEPRYLNVAPFETTGLYGRLYNGLAPTDQPAIEQVDPNVDMHVHFVPLQRPYTTEWTGALRAETAGDYHFAVQSNGEGTLWVDDVQVAQNTQPNGTSEAEAKLTRGWHDIRIRFVDRENFSGITVFWQPPNGPREPIPSTMLRPWPARRVVAARPSDGDLPLPSGTGAKDDGPSISVIAAPDTPAAGPDLKSLGDVKGGGSQGQPRGMAAAPDGTIFVADAGRQVVVMVSPDGSSKLLGEGTLKEPTAVAVLPDGGLIVLDAGVGALLRLGRDGRVGDRLFADFPLYGPRGLTVGPGGQIVLTDTGNGRLLVGPPDGPAVSIPGLAQPTGAAMLRDGTFLVAETAAGRIVQISADGKRLASWLIAPSATVSGPQVVAMPDGGWAVSSPEAHAVVGRHTGDSPIQQFSVGAALRPTGVAVNPAGQLVVVDSAGAALRLFERP